MLDRDICFYLALIAFGACAIVGTTLLNMWLVGVGIVFLISAICFSVAGELRSERDETDEIGWVEAELDRLMESDYDVEDHVERRQAKRNSEEDVYL